MLPRNKLLAQFYKGIFYDRDITLEGKTIPLNKKNGLRYFKVGHLLFIEQNPKKDTKWANLARKGAKIMWLIDTKQNKYIYQVVDRKLTG